MTTYFIPGTEGLTWEQWSAAIINNNPGIFTTPGILPEAAWQIWADEFQLMLRLNAYDAPTPTEFDSWQEWGQRLAGTLVAGL